MDSGSTAGDDQDTVKW